MLYQNYFSSMQWLSLGRKGFYQTHPLLNYDLYFLKWGRKKHLLYSKCDLRITAAIDFFSFFFYNLLLIFGTLNIPLDIKSSARICIDFQVTQQDVTGLVYQWCHLERNILNCEKTSKISRKKTAKKFYYFKLFLSDKWDRALRFLCRCC